MTLISPVKQNADQPRVLEAHLPRFGPAYGEDNGAIKIVKKLAWEHIQKHEAEQANAYYSSVVQIQNEAIETYNTSVIEKLKPGSEFRDMMVKDGCFFLQVAISILGGGKHLRHSHQNPYFGENPSQWIPAMFFVGNQIPYVVIRKLMKQKFFQDVISKGVDSGTWRHPPEDLAKLVLYRTVVEPELKRPGRRCRWKRPPPLLDPPSDILHYLHNTLVEPESHNPIYSEMKEFPDLEANIDSPRANNGDDTNFPKARVFPSAEELLKSGISLGKAKEGITNISFQNFLFFACLYVPPFTIDSDTEHVLKNLTSYEQNMNNSDREVTAYLCLLRDLAPTYKDFKILESCGIIQVKDNKSKYSILLTIKELVPQHCNLTLNFRHIKRKITGYKKPPWGFISILFGLFTIIQTIFAILPYIKATK